MTRNVLLVEDDPLDEKLIVRTLQRAKLDVHLTVAHDGQEALETLFGEDNGFRSQLALIVLDFKLPKIDGLEVLRRLRSHQETRSVPVVFLTSSDLPSDIQAAYEHGANGFVSKPVEYEAFVQSVRGLGQYWVEINRSID